ncbi:MAG TPA: hypothetical protein VFF06_05185 [Polyangia bacterium]|nr:hypothetical protein [Polyangia bacterium]
MVKVLNWNGKDVPAELKDLPAGQYAIEALDHELTPEEQQGLIDAIEEFERTGESVDGETFFKQLRSQLRR